MATWKEGERARVVRRPVTDEDRKTFRYFDYMAGMTGTVQSVYSLDEVALKVDQDTLSSITRAVQKTSIERMREKFLQSVSEEQKKLLTAEELNFSASHVVLVRSADLEAV